MNHSQSAPVEVEELTIGEIRRALALGATEETLREALARLTEGDEVGRRHEQATENYRRYLEARAQRREAVVGEVMDEVDRERLRTGYACAAGRSSPAACASRTTPRALPSSGRRSAA
jgi:hypothetical protein